MERTYHDNNVQGKLDWRDRVTANEKKAFPHGLPNKSIAVVLGAKFFSIHHKTGVNPTSEIGMMLGKHIATPTQIVSVDKSSGITAVNTRYVNVGVKTACGEFDKKVDALSTEQHPAQIVSFDGMKMANNYRHSILPATNCMIVQNRIAAPTILTLNFAIRAFQWKLKGTALEALMMDKNFRDAFNAGGWVRWDSWHYSSHKPGKRGGSTTMGTTVLYRNGKKVENLPCVFPVRGRGLVAKGEEVKKVYRTKDPKWIAAGKKAWKTRIANGNA